MNPYLPQIINRKNEYVVPLAELAAVSPHGTIVKPCIVIAYDACPSDSKKTWLKRGSVLCTPRRCGDLHATPHANPHASHGLSNA
jgi:hypothetical protein